MRAIVKLVIPVVVALALSADARATLIGPDPAADVDLNTPYLQFSDSPFASVDFSAGFFHLETFETADAVTPITTPGVSADHGGPVSVTYGPSVHDSVDADDGVIDGSGLDGESWFYSSGAAGVTFTFDALVLGALPTHAGLVWTDGSGAITFEAFDQNGISLGTLTGAHANGSVNGETAEDRFYGAINAGGISAIRLSNSSGGIELDHLQYGNPTPNGPNGNAPEPATVLLVMAGSFILGSIGRRRRL